MEAVKARLDGIAQDAALWTTPVLVTLSLLDITQYPKELDQGPVLGVVRASGSTYESESLTTDLHGLVVTVWGYVRGIDGVPAGEWLERLWDDHRRALLAETLASGASETLGGLVRDFRPSGELLTDDGGAEPDAWFRQDWLATLTETH